MMVMFVDKFRVVRKNILNELTIPYRLICA
jgi:hypothetical protein